MDFQTTPKKQLNHFESLFSLPLNDIRKSKEFQALRRGAEPVERQEILKYILTTGPTPGRPLEILNLLITENPMEWPTLALITCLARISNCLPDTVKFNEDRTMCQLLENTSIMIKQSYMSLADFIIDKPEPALRSTTPGEQISFRGLRDFVTRFRLPNKRNIQQMVVAIALPNGPLMAAVCIAITTYYTSAPINPAAGAGQFRADIMQAGAQIILTTSDDFNRLGLGDAWVQEAGIDVYLVDWDRNDAISLLTTDGETMPVSEENREPNKADDFALILFTSGTSGSKKVVPLTLHSIIAGVAFVVQSWCLRSSDVCLNMMPLYHVGGLVRNIFAPIFAGGSTVCCPVFDPGMFWDVVEDFQPTWYYASPSMHSLILEEAPSRPDAVRCCRIRLACNAAGALLPALARQLRDTFECVVLPSYGMTECMPISSPPISYELDREGTSGVSTGPELTILDWSDTVVDSHTVGRICVRGEPVFPGYLKPDGTVDKSPFNDAGWFDTGDLGYMDTDGYIYITGRSKEVINRGGELISPFEVENAIMASSLSPTSTIRGRISQVLAFSVPHNVLQEVVAVAIVTPTDAPRIDLKGLHKALQVSLQPAKWPVFIAYMDDLPKKNNKILRIKLGQRMQIPELRDDTPYSSRHWQATCPPRDCDLSVLIPSAPCSIDLDALSLFFKNSLPACVRAHCWQDESSLAVKAVLAPASIKTSTRVPTLTDVLLEDLLKGIHNYMVPEQIHVLQSPLPYTHEGKLDHKLLSQMLEDLAKSSLEELGDTTRGKITKVFSDVLSRPAGALPRDIDFFSLGGDSLKAGRLASSLRSVFDVNIPISIVFHQGTIDAIATYIDKLVESVPTEKGQDIPVGCEERHSSTQPLLMALQLLPLAVIYPMRRALQWTIFIVALSYMQQWPTSNHIFGRLLDVTLAIMMSRIIVKCLVPFFGIAAKWLIIGRYRAGLYPMWGSYHTRWWLVQKIVSICGKGFFSMNDASRRLYYRLLGAKIGKDVKLSGAALGEWDLLDIRDGAVLTRCICRPFAAEGNTSMYLDQIIIGENSFIGLTSIVAAGSIIPPNTCIGPNSSSWEMADADEENRHLSPSQAQKPHWLLTCFLTVPLSFLAWFLSLLPWAGGLVGMVIDLPAHKASPLRDILDWFTEAERIGYHYLALILRCFFSPFILFAFAIFVRLFLNMSFGKLSQIDRKHQGAMAVWRASVIKDLLPVHRLHEMTSMFGQHYEATSIAIRMLGGKVGKRVYWPGTGPSIGDYHLLDIGNDVVFGSRAHLITSDGNGSETITIQDRAMIADRACLLPGVTIGSHTTMGSGALTRRNKTYEAGATFVGSKGGDSVHLSNSRGESHEHHGGTHTHPMASDDTLAGHGTRTKKSSTRTRIKHMSSDDTLAVSRQSRTKRSKLYCRETDDPFTTDSETDGKSEVSAAEGMSPFGRAFYLKLAPYRVLGPLAIFSYSSLVTVFTAFYWNVASVSSIQIVDYVMNRFIPRDSNLFFGITILYLLSWATIAILTTVQALVALLLVVAAKWILLGRRNPGNYDWDKSSYCQRWQLFLCIEKLRRHCYHGQGILGLLTGTGWIVLYFRALGAKIGKDCSLFANGSPNLMFTEPDLITLGDRVTIDDASVVAHINTRGKFDLNSLEIGDRCVMRSGSRLLSGATMKNDSCLLEHTLIMGGDIVEEKWTMQGWPAEKFNGTRIDKKHIRGSSTLQSAPLPEYHKSY